MPLKLKLTKKQLLASGGVVLLLAAAAGFGVLTQQLTKQPKNDQQQPVSDLPEVVNEVQKLRLDGKTEESNKKIDTTLNQQGTSNEVKYLLYMEKGHANYGAQEYQAALDAYTKASEVTPTVTAYRLMGEMYYLLGDKASAKAVYQKALKLVDANSPGAAGEQRDLEQRIAIIDGTEEQ